jgi:hypothetical protein
VVLYLGGLKRDALEEKGINLSSSQPSVLGFRANLSGSAKELHKGSNILVAPTSWTF